MDLSQLQYFLAIVETQGFTKVAELLFVSQPSLSGGIKKLEQELGVVLFERGGRRATLTAAGNIFLEKARNIIYEYQSALQTLQDFQKHPTLRLGVVCTLFGVIYLELSILIFQSLIYVAKLGLNGKTNKAPSL